MDSRILEAAYRIGRMELCFDMLQKYMHKNPSALQEDDVLRELLQKLTAYYEGGQWLHDYELDEMGLLPQGLKRGVLSQDAVYDFLEKMNIPEEVKRNET